MNRLQPVQPFIIGQSQSAFIKGGSICKQYFANARIGEELSRGAQRTGGKVNCTEVIGPILRFWFQNKKNQSIRFVGSGFVFRNRG